MKKFGALSQFATKAKGGVYGTNPNPTSLTASTTTGTDPSSSTAPTSSRQKAWADRIRDKLPVCADNEYEVLWERGVLGVIFLESEKDGIPYVSKATESCISPLVSPGDILKYVNVVRSKDHSFSEFFKILATMKKPVLLRFERCDPGANPLNQRSASAGDVGPRGNRTNGTAANEAAARAQAAKAVRSQSLPQTHDPNAPSTPSHNTHKPTPRGSFWRGNSAVPPTPPSTTSASLLPPPRPSPIPSGAEGVTDTSSEDYDDFEVNWETGSLGLYFAADRSSGQPFVTKSTPGTNPAVDSVVCPNDILVSANNIRSIDYTFEAFFSRLQQMNKPVKLVFRRKRPESREKKTSMDGSGGGARGSEPTMQSNRPKSKTISTTDGSTTESREKKISLDGSGGGRGSESPIQSIRQKSQSIPQSPDTATGSTTSPQRKRLDSGSPVILSTSTTETTSASRTSLSQGPKTRSISIPEPKSAKPSSPRKRSQSKSYGRTSFSLQTPQPSSTEETMVPPVIEVMLPPVAEVEVPTPVPTIETSVEKGVKEDVAVGEPLDVVDGGLVSSSVVESEVHEDTHVDINLEEDVIETEVVVGTDIVEGIEVSDQEEEEEEEENIDSEPTEDQGTQRNRKERESTASDDTEDPDTLEDDIVEDMDVMEERDSVVIATVGRASTKESTDGVHTLKPTKASVNPSLAKYRKKSKNSRPLVKLPKISEQEAQTVPLVAPNAVNTTVQVRGRSRPKPSLIETPDSSTYLVKWKEGRSVGLQLREVRFARGVFPLVMDVCRESCCEGLKHVYIGDVILEINGRNCSLMGVKKTVTFLKTSTKTMLLKFRHGPAFSNERVSAYV